MMKLRILRENSNQILCELPVALVDGEFVARVDAKMAAAIESAIPERKITADDVARELGFDVTPTPEARERVNIARDSIKRELQL